MIFVQSLFIILAIIFVGIMCEKKKLLDHAQIEGCEIFLFKIAMPCYLFNSSFHTDFALLMHTKYIASYLLTFIVISILVGIVFYKKDTKSVLCIKMLASGYVNTSIYTLPIITFLLRDPIAGILSNLLQVIIIQSSFIIILSFINHKEKTLAKKLNTILSMPLIVMPLIGLCCNYLQVNIPSVLIQIVQSLGSGASSIALYTFGLTLGSMKLNKAHIDQNLILIITLKNIVHPILAFFIGVYLFHLEDYWLYSLVITTSAPTAFVVYLLSKRFSIEQDLAKRVVTISSICSLASLIIINFILE